MNKKIEAESVKLSAEEELERLLQSGTIKLVYEREYEPKDVDNAMKNMKKEIEELKYQSFLDRSEIVRLRRQVEFLIGHDGG